MNASALASQLRSLIRSTGQLELSLVEIPVRCPARFSYESKPRRLIPRIKVFFSALPM
jgi:hypothetical protein